MLLAALFAMQVLVDVPDSAEGCTDKEGTVALASCYAARGQAWERRMHAAYPTALKSVDGPRRRRSSARRMSGCGSATRRARFTIWSEGASAASRPPTVTST